MGDGQYTPARDSYENARAGLAGLRDFYKDDQFGAFNQSAYNATMGITMDNPYGYEGIFSRRLGIDPRNISYKSNLTARQRANIANNQYDKYMNPFRDLGQGKGELRPGAQKEGFMTEQGNVMSQYREQPMSEMLARGVFSLAAPLPLGLALSQIGTKEYGIEGSPGFDPNNPRGSGLARGIARALTGVVDPTSAAEQAARGVDAIQEFFSPETPMPGVLPVSPPDRPARNPDELAGFEQRFNRPPSGTGIGDRPSVSLTVTPNEGLSSLFTDPTTDRPVPSPVDRVNQTNTGIPQDVFDDILDELFGPRVTTEELQQRNDAGLLGDRLSSSFNPAEPDLLARMGLVTPVAASTIDTTNLYDQGGGMYRTTPKQSTLDKVLEAIGVRKGRSGPAAQIFVPKDETSIFDNINFGRLFD